ncbi:MAG: OsmC family protein ['Candidatus Kapabacteria' thiocyanatum]|uniref:OsmC family peroxiredoxin n=1 Tax=Candidatus Kapaibacterium thiocyanatum TaxID=1895771 RepID=A0A1M3L3J8_9BACT|nr:OsmC family protein ['Candidatus Kapabacteria' thiocyanatum]OJX59938.1 MAG: OsmC family peroxiredoxin ['Candidatus Kapabacteria' thiocyanatum]
MKRTATAHWNGTIKEGKGDITTQSGVLKATPYAFNTRFDNGVGTNPEELIGAAHAGCFTMALSAALTQAGITPGNLETTAEVELDVPSLTITNIVLNLKADQIAGVASDKFMAIAAGAKENCPVSKVLAGATIMLNVEYR